VVDSVTQAEIQRLVLFPLWILKHGNLLGREKETSQETSKKGSIFAHHDYMLPAGGTPQRNGSIASPVAQVYPQNDDSRP
jgi:hypothetical protein